MKKLIAAFTIVLCCASFAWGWGNEFGGPGGGGGLPPCTQNGYVPAWNTSTNQWNCVANGSGTQTWPSCSNGSIFVYNGASGFGTCYNSGNQIPFNFLTGAQASSPNLTTLAGITPGAEGQSLLAAANAAAVKTLLSYYTSADVGVSIEAYSAILAAIAGTSQSTGYLYWNGSAWVYQTPSGTAAWGGITGTLSSQTDLQNALNAKQSIGAVYSNGTKTTTLTFTASNGVNQSVTLTTGDALVLSATGGVNQQWMTLTVIVPSGSSGTTINAAGSAGDYPCAWADGETGAVNVDAWAGKSFQIGLFYDAGSSTYKVSPPPPAPGYAVIVDSYGRAIASTVADATLAYLDATSSVQTQLNGKLSLSGGTLTGKETTVASASGGAGFNLPPGTAPTSPANGDLWTTSAGLYAYINGGTVGPFGVYPGAGLPISSGTGWNTSLTIASLTGLIYDTAGTLSVSSTLPTAAEPAHTGDCTNSAGSLTMSCTKTGGTAFGTFATQSYGSTAVGDILLGGTSGVPTGKLADVATGSVLVSGGVGAAPAYAAIGSASGVQPYNANLTTYAGQAPNSTALTALGNAPNGSGGFTTYGTDLPLSGGTMTGTITNAGANNNPTYSSTTTATGNINIDGASYADYNYNDGSTAVTYTPVITSPPPSGTIRYVTFSVGGGSGVCTMTWTNVTFMGTSGASATTASKISRYVCMIPHSGNAICQIINEGGN